MKGFDSMVKVVYVVSLVRQSEVIGVFDDMEKMVNAIIEDLENSEYWNVAVEWYCDENNIDYYTFDDDENFDYGAFNNSVKGYVKRNIKRDETFLDDYYFIEFFYLNNETS